MKPPTIQTNAVRVWRAKAAGSAFIRRLPLIACLSLAISSKATLPTSDLPDLDSLMNFAEVGDQLDDNSGTVNGNVGVFSRGILRFTMPARDRILGNVYLGTNASLTRMAVVNGSVFSDQNLSIEQSDVFSNSVALGKLTPDQTIRGNQTRALSYDVSPGQVKVVDLDGGLNLNNQNIMLSGGGDLVLNIKGSFSLNGSAGILGNPDDIFINYEGTRAITTHASNRIDALIFDPNAAASLNGMLSGGFYGERKTITLEPGATLTEAPEPKELTFAGLAAVLVHLARRRICKKR